MGPEQCAPGTVVSASEQRMILRDLKEQGFEAINIQQLAGRW
jgi:hypothetical protein